MQTLVCGLACADIYFHVQMRCGMLVILSAYNFSYNSVQMGVREKERERKQEKEQEREWISQQPTLFFA